MYEVIKIEEKRLRIIRLILLVIALIVISVIFAPGLFANKALKIAISTAGTKALTVKVSVDKVALSVLRGRISLYNLIVDNPEGYQHEKLLELKQADVKVIAKSLLTEVVNIEQIKLDGTKVVFEQKGVSSNNLQDIIKKLPPQKQESEPSGKKLHIKNLEIVNTEVQIKLMPIPGQIDTIPLKLSKIELTNLGADNNLDMIELSREILLAIAGGIAQQGAGIIPEEVLTPFVSELQKFGALSGVILDSGKKILESGTDIGKEAKKIGENVGKGVLDNIDDTGKGIGEGLKGILRPEEEE